MTTEEILTLLDRMTARMREIEAELSREWNRLRVRAYLGLSRRRQRVLVLLLTVYCSPFTVPAQAAVGDVVADCQSIASAALLDIQPGAGVEWIIHNIGFTHEVELQRYDGTDTAAMVTFSGPGWQNFFPGIHVNNTQRIRVKNNDASSRVICYDGIITK